MRIAHIESSMHWGGQELRIVEQTEWLNKHGHPTWIIARPGSAIVDKAQKKALPLQVLPIKGSCNPVTLRNLLNFLRRNKIDILDCHGNRDSRYGAYARWLTKMPVIRSRHIIDPIRNDYFNRLVWRYGNDGIIVTADKIRKMIIEAQLNKPDRIVVAEAGVDEKRFHPGVRGLTLRRQLGIPEHHFVVANVGMIRPDKGQLQFIKACKKLLEKHADMTCIQIGEAPTHSLTYKEKVLAIAGEYAKNGRIRFLGYHSDIENWLAIADAVVIASVATEAKTRLVAQAFLMKKNIVATTVGGLVEMIDDKNTGLLCPPDNPDALADAVELLIKDKTKAQDLREQAYLYAAKSMTFDYMMKGMLAAYQKAIQSSKRE